MDYKHIVELEEIHNRHLDLINRLEGLLNEWVSHQGNYQKLRHYYHSQQFFQDVEASNQGSIPKEIKQGILSEDAVYNLIGDNYQLAIHMLEIATEIIKNH